jgi:hypothetical protein
LPVAFTVLLLPCAQAMLPVQYATPTCWQQQQQQQQHGSQHPPQGGLAAAALAGATGLTAPRRCGVWIAVW